MGVLEMSKYNRHTVAQLVSDRIRDCHPEGVSLEVDEQGIRKVDCQWRVPIRPSAEPVNRYEYYEALTDIEIELSEQEKLNVFLVPRDPKPPQASERQQPMNDGSAATTR
jgi:hypothetical protein